MLHRSIWVLTIGSLIILSGCFNSDAKELKKYMDIVEEDFLESNFEKDVEKYVSLIVEEQPEEALTSLKDTVIPKYEKRLKKFKEMDYKSEDVNSLNDQIIILMQVDVDRQTTFKDIFEIIIENNGQTIDTTEFDAQLDNLHKLNETNSKEMDNFEQKIEDLSKKYDFMKINEEFFQMMDVNEINRLNDLLIMQFFAVVTGIEFDLNEFIEESTPVDFSFTQDNSNASNDTEDENTNTTDDLTQLINDKGNPHVVFDAEVEIENNFKITGKSNLLEGSTILLKSYQYGSENPYLKGEIIVDENGDFTLELDLDKDSLNGEPVTLRLAYQPDKENKEAQELYGEEGEKLEGPFKHKYTNIKRTRYGAFTYAHVEFNEGEKAQFSIPEWKNPDDYGELNVWMEEDNIDIKDNYYDITMRSNLNELTGIKADVEIPGYDTAGFTSRATVMFDGSFRFQIPRPDLDEDVTIIVDATSDFAIETEELYGEHGENFQGDLVTDTKRGQKVQYKFTIKN